MTCRRPPFFTLRISWESSPTSFINVLIHNFTATLTNNELLSLDMGTITVYDETPQLPTVSSILIYMQCEDILSNRKLRTRLNPISIKLEQLSNFPDATVVANNYQYLYAKTTFVDRTVVTAYYTPARAIYFQFVKCFLREDFRPEELISFILTKFLTVEIIGVRIKNAGSVETESSKAPEVSVQEVLLGVATFDLSDFLRGSREVRLASSLFHPRSIYCPNSGDENDKNVSIWGKDSPLTSDSLMSFGTSVKIKARLACDLRAVYENVLQRDDILNRIFMILNNLNLACDILDEVSSHNSPLSVTRGSSNEDFEAEAQEEEHSRDILTGFVIYCSDKYYIFFEGLANGYLLNVWEKVAKLPIADGRVYYNSSCVFLRGLYTTATRFSGFVEIKLSEPLEVHLCNCSLYIGKTRTTVPAKIVRTMGLMKLTTTMKSLCQNCLFPDPRDINILIDEFVKLIYNILEKTLT
ncbi:uncharacterized protein LOC143376200 [Andrena cerasifolii]|uniref:uncharacterized protein LOC143376200 n=1 Tax=Andrena cerasifolii TaxID=2819439 RepID=UPI004037E07E